ncbi:patatin-like phospholipase family protein [Legionella shakespearei]|uniref:Alpha-beta hydrolase family transporter esterase n=1 Tax=Legionella shakespearei DSM 23087 TaxID=1122169 RepID=A0A0W0YKW0_9GAMM|nr:patatin-like phospholipase family protein [Legionella shakespearei]KTD57262.1 alpha-beta hydrolase family transporter esterase [Legionella shakespearei DSM 23087]
MVRAKNNNKNRQQYTNIACTFQGGGALGAYQAGILHALDDAGYYPDWFVGTSIGAINAAIAAGNPEKVRIEKLYQFWESIATQSCIDELFPNDQFSRQLHHYMSSQNAILYGQPGFFIPRFPSPHSGWHNTPDFLSYYDTSPLKETLEKFVDFERINNQKVTRLCVGAVEICSGQMIYFDSHKQKIGPEHIMASGALPPGFPAVKIDDKFYWDGGLASNTPVAYVLCNQDKKHLLCFMVQLFDSYGLDPKNFDEIIKRKKDIEYASRLNRMIDVYKQVQTLKNSIHVLSKLVPRELKEAHEIKECISRGEETTIALVNFLCEHDGTELSSKDYEFSKKSISELITYGYHDGKKAIKKSPWKEKIPITEGIVLHDMARVNKMKEHLDE